MIPFNFDLNEFWPVYTVFSKGLGLNYTFLFEQQKKTIS